MMPNALFSSNFGNALKSSIPGVSDFLIKMFGKDPYKDSQQTYDEGMNKSYSYLDPYNQAGQRGLGKYEQMLGRMSDPQAFVNNILSNYSMSPAAKMELNQGEHALSSAASASGMLGSSAFGDHMADYAERLTSKDMQQYLQNILGVNRDALSGYSDLSHMGLSAGSQESQQAANQAAQDAKFNYADDQYGNSKWADLASIVSNFL